MASDNSSSLTGSDFRWVDTVVELKSIIGKKSRPAAIVGGYWEYGDGEGGIFYWDRSSSSGDNGVKPTQPGTIIVPNESTSGRWVRIYSGEINVKWFGARGQGTDVNDAPAINRAISVAGTSQAAVFIPRGIYRLDAALDMSFPGVRLTGEGDSATILEKVGASADTIVFKRTSKQCQVAHLQIRPRGGSKQNSGAARVDPLIFPSVFEADISNSPNSSTLNPTYQPDMSLLIEISSLFGFSYFVGP